MAFLVIAYGVLHCASSLIVKDVIVRAMPTLGYPFIGMDRNSSWDGVNAINKDELESELNIKLYRAEISVSYDYVDTAIPKLWENYQPDLTIHVGMGTEQALVLETKARKDNYEYVDDYGLLPANKQNASVGLKELTTELDAEMICKEINQLCADADGILADMSDDAGHFLCEYIYYTSLSQNKSKTLFVHVPDTKIYSVEQIAQGLERVLKLCVRQIRAKQQFDF